MLVRSLGIALGVGLILLIALFKGLPVLIILNLLKAIPLFFVLWFAIALIYAGVSSDS